MWGNYDKRGKWNQWRVSIDQIADANGEEGTLNACMYVQERKKDKNWSQCVCLQNVWTLTVSPKDSPELLIWKIHKIVSIYATRFFCGKYRTFFTNYNIYER